MEVRQIRQLNFEVLLSQYIEDHGDEKRTLKMFADLMGMNPAHLSQIRSGHRKIGSRLARQIESNLKPKVEEGWLDKEHRESDPCNKHERELVDLAVELFRQNPIRMKKLLAQAEREFGRKNRAVRVGRRTAEK